MASLDSGQSSVHGQRRDSRFHTIDSLRPCADCFPLNECVLYMVAPENNLNSCLSSSLVSIDISFQLSAADVERLD